MTKNKKRSSKKLLVAVTCIGLAAAIAAGAAFLGLRKQEPVGVYPFMMVGMDGYWGDTQESYGPVATDKIQTVYLSDTQTVTEVLVSPGDSVKKGDVLMTFDTTLSDLQLERKRLEVEKLKLQLEEAKDELWKIRNLEPMEVPEDVPLPETPPAANLGTAIPSPYVYQKNVVSGHDGLTADTAFICWLRSDTPITSVMLDEMRQFLWKYHGQPELCEHGNLEPSCQLCARCPHGKQEGLCGVCSPEICQHNKIKDHCDECHPCVHGEPAGKCDICYPDICEHENIEAFCELCHRCPHGKAPSECGICRPRLCEHKQIPALCQICNPPPTEGGDEGSNGSSGSGDQSSSGSTDPQSGDSSQDGGSGILPEEGAGEVQPTAFASKPYRIQLLSNTSVTSTDMTFYVVFKTTAGDTDLGATSLWQGIQVVYEDGMFNQQFFTPAIEDYTQPKMDDTSVSVIPEINIGSGFTAAQIAQMRADQEKKIKQLEFDIRFATAEYKIMQKEVSDGRVYAEIDGNVVSILTEEEAKQQKQPVLKVSGGGGFTITGSVSELERENLKIGQEVTVNDWSAGGTYTGTVQSIGDFPSSDNYWSGAGNPNTTYYPFTVFVGEEASLQAGNYANIQYSTSESTGGIYLEKAFLRTEDGQSYVYLRGEDGLLEKRFVTTGKTLWGSYMEITSGLTAQDYLAFPYGKHVKPGAPTQEKEISELYGY